MKNKGGCSFEFSTSKTAITPDSLPPTSDASAYHSYRAYHQVQVWRGQDIPPLSWGWKILNNKMVPIAMKQAPAPSNLLKVVRCGCKTGCKTSACTCLKHGLKCTPVCKECRGVSCVNCQVVLLESCEDD